MNKKIIEEQICYYSDDEPVAFGVLQDIELKQDDIIIAGYEDGEEYVEYSQGYYILKVIRPRIETDEEYELRMKKEEKDKEDRRKNRYSHYLRLKKEFDNE